jgi:iron complex outermembrane receptor protein
MSGKRLPRAPWLRVFCQSLMISAATCSIAGVAQAQQSSGSVETVTVTAEKRVENVQNVPISMEVISGKQIDEFHQTDLHSIMNTIPDLFVLQSGVDDVVAIRGFGSGPNNIAFDQEVSIYEDGIYGGRSAQFMEPFFDVDHVEVLRGPQGALFGKNTAAGAVSVTTAGPTDTFQGSGTASYNFIESGPELDGWVSGPISDDLGARLAVKFVDQDGFIKNLATGKDDPQTKEALARLTLKYAPVSNFDVTGKVEYSNEQIDGGINVSGPLNELVNPPDTRYLTSGPFGEKEGNSVVSTNASVTANYRFSGFTLTSITGYSEFTTTRLSAYDQTLPGGGLTGSPFVNGFPEKFNQESEEVRLLSPAGQALEYIVGAYYDASDYDLYQFRDYANLFGLTGADHSNFTQHSNTVSVFAEATYHVADDFRLIGSLRYSDTTKQGNFTSGITFGDGLGGPPSAYGSATGSINEPSVDPSFTAQYDASKNVMFYATYAHGSKSGGFTSNNLNTTTDADFTFKPERSVNYEVGMKGTFLDGRLVANGTLFNMNFKDLQESAFDSTTAEFVTNNAGSATSRGFEGQLTWLPVDSLELSSSFAYLEAKYDSYKGASCLALEPTSVCDPNDTNPADPNSVVNHNDAGLPLLYASKWTGNVQAHHTLMLGNDLQFDTTLVAMLRTKYFDSDDYDPYYGIQPTYVKFDARLQLGSTDNRWDVALVGKNLTNVLSVGDSLAYPLGIDRAMKWLDEGRSVAIEATYRF